MPRYTMDSSQAFHGEDFNDNVLLARRLQARAMGDAFNKAAKATVRFVFGSAQRA